MAGTDGGRGPRHQFIDPSDCTKGGTWVGDYGRLLCRWSWNPNSKKLTITCGPHGRYIDVGKLPQGRIALVDVLPRLALGAANRIMAELHESADQKR